jgi:hypothetical protein
MRFVLVTLLIGLTALPAFAEPHAPEQVKDAFQRFAAKEVDHEEKIAAVLSSFPKYAALPDRPEVLKKAMELVAPLAEMKFANCKGDLIELEIVENEAGTHRILQKETTASSYYSNSSAHTHTDTETPFRPLWVDGDFLLAEMPGNQALDKKMASAAVRQFKIMHFHKEEGRTHLETHDIYLVNGKVISMPPEKLEESSVLKCRTQWSKDAEEGRVSPPTQLQFQKGLQGHTDFARAEDPEQAKALKLIAEVLGKDGVPVDAAKGLSDEELKLRRKQLAEQTDLKKQLAALDSQAAEEAEKIKVAKAKKQNLEKEYWEVIKQHDSAQADLRAAKENAEKRWKTYQDYKNSEHRDTDDTDLSPDGHLWDRQWSEDLAAARYKNWAGYEKIDSKKLRAAKKALRTKLTKYYSDEWYSWIEKEKEFAKKAEELSRKKQAQDTYDTGSSLSQRTAEQKIISEGEALLGKLAKVKEEVLKTAAEAVPVAHEKYQAAIKQNKARVVSPSIFGKLPENAKNGDVYVLAPMDKETRSKYSANSAHLDLLLGKAPFFDVLKIDPKTGEIKERAMVIFTDPNWKKTTMLAASSAVNTSLMERLKMIWNGEWQKDFLDWQDFKNRDLYLNTADGVDPEPIHLEKLVGQVVAGQKIIANTRKESTPISEVIDAPKVREFFAKHGLSTQDSNPNLVYMPALAGSVKSGLVAGVVPNDVVEKFAGNIPKRFAKPLMEKELGKEWLISMYPAAQIKKEMREVAVHEWAHLLDLNQWKVNPVTSDRVDVKKLEEEFERVFPTLVQLERYGRKYQAEYEEFKNDIPADEEKISKLTPEQQQEYIRKEFEKQYFGEDQESFKRSLKESYTYLRSPVEKIAWATQIAYLRDIEGMTFDQVLAQTNRIGGAHSEQLSNGMKEQYLRELYEEPNLKKIIERSRLEASFLFR